jgi:hypothetical protein
MHLKYALHTFAGYQTASGIEQMQFIVLHAKKYMIYRQRSNSAIFHEIVCHVYGYAQGIIVAEIPTMAELIEVLIIFIVFFDEIHEFKYQFALFSLPEIDSSGPI